MSHERFNIRVYGVLERDEQVLISHERIADRVYAKFPGGGLEFGEGPKDAVIREFREELGIDVTVTDHVYTTDFYLPSAFSPKDQIISIYYRVKAPSDAMLPFHLPPPTDAEVMRHSQVFRWHRLSALNGELLVLPADRVVAGMLNRVSEK